MRHTHNRSQRFGGHTKHTFYCSCGRQVSGNGGKQHFKLDGHKRVTWETWKAASGTGAEGDGSEGGDRDFADAMDYVRHCGGPEPKQLLARFAEMGDTA